MWSLPLWDPILPLVHLDPAGQCWLDSAVNLGPSPMGLLGPLDPIHATRVEAQKSMLTNDGELLIQAQLSLGDTMKWPWMSPQRGDPWRSPSMDRSSWTCCKVTLGGVQDKALTIHVDNWSLEERKFQPGWPDRGLVIWLSLVLLRCCRPLAVVTWAAGVTGLLTKARKNFHLPSQL